MTGRAIAAVLFASSTIACHDTPPPADDAADADILRDVAIESTVPDATLDATMARTPTGYVAITSYFDPATEFSSSAQAGFEDPSTAVDCAAPDPALEGCAYVECPVIPADIARPAAGVLTVVGPGDTTLATLTADTMGDYPSGIISGDPWADGGASLRAMATGSTAVPAFTLALTDPGRAHVTSPVFTQDDSGAWSIAHGTSLPIDWSPRTSALEVTLTSTVPAGMGVLRCVFAPGDAAPVIPAAMIARLGAGAGGPYAFATLGRSDVHAGSYVVAGLVRRVAEAGDGVWASGEYVVP